MTLLGRHINTNNVEVISYIRNENIILNYRKNFSFLIKAFEMWMLLVQIYYCTVDNILHLETVDVQSVYWISFSSKFIPFDTYHNTKLPHQQHQYNLLVLFSQLPSIYHFSLNNIAVYNFALWESQLYKMGFNQNAYYKKLQISQKKLVFWLNVLDNGWRCFWGINR